MCLFAVALLLALCAAAPCKYSLSKHESVADVARMFGVSVDAIRAANAFSVSPGVIAVPSEECSPSCPKPNTECDVLWMREQRCERDGVVATVSCRALGQRCDSRGQCTAKLRHCTDACDRGVCGEGGVRPVELVWPAPSSHEVLRAFGGKDADSSCGFHTGVDIGGQVGSMVVAAASGRVVHVGPLWVEGEGVGRGDAAIVIQHHPGLFTVYSHNSRALVGTGLCVEAGQEIARMGSEGFTQGVPHVHVELLDDPTGKLKFASWPVPFYHACRFYKDFTSF